MNKFNALPIITQQIGYSLIFDTYYDFGRILLYFIGDKLIADRVIVYYARFGQLIFSYYCRNVDIPKSEEIEVF